jgi:hypothetical protein
MMQERWLQQMMQKWVSEAEQLAIVALRYPQSAYVGLVSCLQANWIGSHLEEVKVALRIKFFPALLGGQETISDKLHLSVAQGRKQCGLAICTPVM